MLDSLTIKEEYLDKPIKIFQSFSDLSNDQFLKYQYYFLFFIKI